MWRRDWPVIGVALITFLNGCAGILHALLVRLPEPRPLGEVLPFGLLHWGKLLGLLTGFLLVDLSYHLWRRRRAAWAGALILSLLAAVSHLLRVHTTMLAAAPALTAGLLLLLRDRFTVRSEPRSIAQGLGLVAGSLLVAVAYGGVGFWLLDRRDFGMDFHWQEACVRSLRQYALLGNPDLVPRTSHARWFLDSLEAMGVVAVLFAAFSLYRPLTFRLRTLPQERADARRLVELHGRSSMDHFKVAGDKSFFFGPDRAAFVAYRAAWGVAVGLGDPVGSPESIEPTLCEFLHACRDNGWRVAFHQVATDWLLLYRKLGLHVLKIGEEGLIDLGVFQERTARSREFRKIRSRSAGLGQEVLRYDPPVPPDVMDALAEVSEEWLRLPGRRERGFTLGRFRRAEVAATPVFALRDAAGRILAFVNQIPCWPEGTATVDLMRHRLEIPNGTMDALFLRTLELLSERYRRFSLGLAPLAGVGDRPGAPLEERAVHQMYERLNRFFSYKGLRSYKAKFDPIWEERFLVYTGGPRALLQVGIALGRITEG
jgi:phosphatidylglycerol lysyltransferase